jgi:hypothetical protein
MRIAVITLSVVALFVMSDHTVIPLRVSILISSEVRPNDALSSLVLFSAWAVATALVYPMPAVAVWLFALAGVFGLFDGLSNSIEELAFWGSIALGLAALSSFARREKQSADRLELAREQHYRAVHAALRSLQESAPHLLDPTPDIGPSGSHTLRPMPASMIPSQRQAARRA